MRSPSPSLDWTWSDVGNFCKRHLLLLGVGCLLIPTAIATWAWHQAERAPKQVRFDYEIAFPLLVTPPLPRSACAPACIDRFESDFFKRAPTPQIQKYFERVLEESFGDHVGVIAFSRPLQKEAAWPRHALGLTLVVRSPSLGQKELEDRTLKSLKAFLEQHFFLFAFQELNSRLGQLRTQGESARFLGQPVPPQRIHLASHALGTLRKSTPPRFTQSSFGEALANARAAVRSDPLLTRILDNWQWDMDATWNATSGNSGEITAKWTSLPYGLLPHLKTTLKTFVYCWALTIALALLWEWAPFPFRFTKAPA